MRCRATLARHLRSGLGRSTPADWDDRALVQRVRAGEVRASEALLHRYHEPLHRFCHSILRNREDAEEALRQTMLAAHTVLISADRRGIVLRPWLYRIARNECLSALRRRSMRQTEPLIGAEPAGTGVEEHAERSAELAQLRRDLAELAEAPRGAGDAGAVGGWAARRSALPSVSRRRASSS